MSTYRNRNLMLHQDQNSGQRPQRATCEIQTEKSPTNNKNNNASLQTDEAILFNGNISPLDSNINQKTNDILETYQGAEDENLIANNINPYQKFMNTSLNNNNDIYQENQKVNFPKIDFLFEQRQHKDPIVSHTSRSQGYKAKHSIFTRRHILNSEINTILQNTKSSPKQANKDKFSNEIIKDRIQNISQLVGYQNSSYETNYDGQLSKFLNRNLPQVNQVNSKKSLAPSNDTTLQQLYYDADTNRKTSNQVGYFGGGAITVLDKYQSLKTLEELQSSLDNNRNKSNQSYMKQREHLNYSQLNNSAEYDQSHQIRPQNKNKLSSLSKTPHLKQFNLYNAKQYCENYNHDLTIIEPLKFKKRKADLHDQIYYDNNLIDISINL